jgi:hypothetical protein
MPAPLPRAIATVYTAQQVPKLALDYVQMCFAAEHPTLGYVYVFSCDHTTYDDGGVVVYDTDKNGTIDQFEELSISQWPTKVSQVQWVRTF